MIATRHLRITQPDGLVRILRLPAPDTVELALPSLGAAETSDWQGELNALLRTCGCGEATAFFLVATAAMLALAYVWWNSVKTAPTAAILIGLGCAIASIAIGKAFGKLRGRRRLKASVRRLQAVVQDRALAHGASSPSNAALSAGSWSWV